METIHQVIRTQSKYWNCLAPVYYATEGNTLPLNYPIIPGLFTNNVTLSQTGYLDNFLLIWQVIEELYFQLKFLKKIIIYLKLCLLNI